MNSAAHDNDGLEEEEEEEMLVLQKDKSSSRGKKRGRDDSSSVKQEHTEDDNQFLETCRFISASSGRHKGPKESGGATRNVIEQTLQGLQVPTSSTGYFYALPREDKKLKLSGQEEMEPGPYVQARKCAFDTAWAVVERAVSKVMERVNEGCFQQVYDFIQTPQSRKQVPVALIQTGINTGDRSMLFSHLAHWLNEHMECIVVTLDRTNMSSLNKALSYIELRCSSFFEAKCKKIKQALRKTGSGTGHEGQLAVVREQLERVEKEIGKLKQKKNPGLLMADRIILWSYVVGYALRDCALRLCWIARGIEAQFQPYPLVLLLEGIESPQAPTFQFLVQRLSTAWFRASHLGACENIAGHRTVTPLRLVLPLSGTSETFHQQASMDTIKRLNITNIHIENPLKSVHQLMHHLLTLGNLPLSFGSNLLEWLPDYILKYNLSVKSFMTCLHYVLLDKYSGTRFSFLASYVPNCAPFAFRTQFSPSHKILDSNAGRNPFSASSLSRETLRGISGYEIMRTSPTNPAWRCFGYNYLHSTTATWRTIASRISKLKTRDIEELLAFKSVGENCQKDEHLESASRIRDIGNEVLGRMEEIDHSVGMGSGGLCADEDPSAHSASVRKKSLPRDIQDHLSAPTTADLELNTTPLLWPMGFLPTIDEAFHDESGKVDTVTKVGNPSEIRLCSFLFRFHQRRIARPYIFWCLAYSRYDAVTTSKLREIESYGEANDFLSSEYFNEIRKRLQRFSVEELLEVISGLEEVLLQPKTELVSLKELGWIQSLESDEGATFFCSELACLELIRRELNNPSQDSSSLSSTVYSTKRKSGGSRGASLQSSALQTSDVSTGASAWASKLVISFLEKLVCNFMISCECLPLHEIVTVDLDRRLARVLTAQPREAMLRSLENHQLYLPSTPDIGPNVHDTVLAYQVYRYASKKLFVKEWYQAFKAFFVPDGKDPVAHLSTSLLDKRRSGTSKKRNKNVRRLHGASASSTQEEEEPDVVEISPEKEEELKARFVQSVTELSWMGFIEQSKYSLDSVTRLVFDVRQW
eukprot:gb/GECG01016254.1/.p1 GENE.gb/GECG01016254.1/~~gb/GECG01016254.1/.p1  ORF type:complete len:1042 (+),score=114.64 gb/GECG01016254.1/:1-3126(+)